MRAPLALALTTALTLAGPAASQQGPPACQDVAGFSTLGDGHVETGVGHGPGHGAGGVKEKRLMERYEDGGVRFQGEIALPDGRTYLDRTTLSPLDGGRVRQHIEISTDGGRSWRTTFDAVYVPR